MWRSIERFYITWTAAAAIVLAALSFVFALAVLPLIAQADAAPAVSVGQADYEAGATVAIVGTNFVPGETVHVSLAGDTNGSALSIDVVADDHGAISGSVTLPLMYEANYAVTARGSSGSLASASFTDVNHIKIQTPSNPVTLYPGQTQLYEAIVTGAGNAPVSGVVVTFTIGANGGAVAANGGSLSGVTYPTGSGKTGTDGLARVTLTAGTPNATGHYHVQASGGGATNSQDYDIAKLATSITGLTDVPDPSVQFVAYTVSWTLAAAGGPAATGTVSVSDGTNSCSAVIPATSCLLTSATVGTLTLVATYSGDTVYASSTATTTHVVTPADTTPPVLSLSNVAAEATGPSGAAVTYTATATDAVDGPRPVTCSPASGSTFPPGVTTVNCSASDLSGNTATGSFSVTVVDTTPPVINVPLAQADAEATSPSGAVVTYTVNGSDLVSGAVSVTCTPSSGSTFPLGVTTVNCSATDGAGNVGTASFSVTVVDKVAPTVTCAAADGLWHAANVAVPCTATDAGSGLAVAGDAAFVLSTTVAAGQETANASTGTHSVCDLAGNCVTAGPVAGNQVDRKAPVVTCTAPDQSVWYNADQSVPCSATDGGSGVATAPTTLVAAGEGAAISTGTTPFCDNVGNCVDAGPYSYKIDKTPPVVTAAATTAANANGWYNADVTVHFTCTDNLSGVVLCPSDQLLTASGSSAAVTVTDHAGNVSAPANVVTVQVDKVAPTVTQSAIANGSPLGTLGTCTASDNVGGSGMAGAVSQTVSYQITAGGIVVTVNCTGSDRAGNSTTATVTYTTKAAQACVWMQPVLSPVTVFNTGNTIPLKVICLNAAGAGFQVPGLSMAVTVTGPAATSMTNVNMGFTSDHYQANWNTPKNQAVGTYTATAMFNDGSALAVKFSLVK